MTNNQPPKQPREWTIYNGNSEFCVSISGSDIAYSENVKVIEKSAYEALERELAAYKKAKEENDERFQNELADTRQSYQVEAREADSLRKKITELQAQLDEANEKFKDRDRRVDDQMFLILDKDKRIKELETALVNIKEYWNQDCNEQAMKDACYYAIETADQALQGKGE